MMKSWDLSLSASIGSAEIEDFFTKSELQIILMSKEL